MRRCRIQSKPFSLGERAQPGAPRIGVAPRVASSSRLPGSTGMPNRSIRPPNASIAAGMTSRRSVMAEAPKMTSASAPGDSPRKGVGERADLVGRRLLRDDARAGRREAGLERLERLGDDAHLEPRQQGGDDGDPQRPEGRDGDGARAAERRDSGLERRAVGRKRDDLDGGDHVAIGDRSAVGQRGDGDGFVDRVDSVDRGGIEDREPGGLGEEVHASGERGGATHMRLPPDASPASAPPRSRPRRPLRDAPRRRWSRPPPPASAGAPA